MGVPGIGPGTSSLSGTRSNQLSYTPKLEIFVLPLGPAGPEGTRDFKTRWTFILSGAPFHLRRTLSSGLLLRKEVIQPLVPQRLPCYDFIPITTHTFDGSLRLRVQTAFMM